MPTDADRADSLCRIRALWRQLQRVKRPPGSRDRGTDRDAAYRRIVAAIRAEVDRYKRGLG